MVGAYEKQSKRQIKRFLDVAQGFTYARMYYRVTSFIKPAFRKFIARSLTLFINILRLSNRWAIRLNVGIHMQYSYNNNKHTMISNGLEYISILRILSSSILLVGVTRKSNNYWNKSSLSWYVENWNSNSSKIITIRNLTWKRNCQ